MDVILKLFRHGDIFCFMAPPSVQFQLHHLYCNFLTVNTTPQARCINEVSILKLSMHFFIHMNKSLRSMLVIMSLHCMYLAPDNLFKVIHKKRLLFDLIFFD